MENPQFTTAFVKPDTMPANNLAAYADWRIKTITVTFDTGTTEVEAPPAQEILATETVKEPEPLSERPGYTHVGWIDQSGKVFNFSTVLYEDTTLSAIWKADDEQGHCLTYELNTESAPLLFEGYKGETSYHDAEHFAAGDYHDLWTIEHVFELENEQYAAFVGWNTKADGTGSMYYPGDEILVTEEQILYAVWARENLSTLVLDHNYPAGYEPKPGEKEKDTITDRNLASIDLAGESALTYHDEIQVTGSDGNTHRYRFDGWSTQPTKADSATDEDVEFSADAQVAVDTISKDSKNVLYAVWLEVGSITVTKEVVNPAVNGADLKDAVFDFTWSVDSGNGDPTTGEEKGIPDGGSFEVPDVAAGETVTIFEAEQKGYTAACKINGQDVEKEADGSFRFTASDALEDHVTVVNTVDTKEITVRKVWADKDGSEETGALHEGVTVEVFDGEESIKEFRLDESCSWSATLTVLADEDRTYSVKEHSVPGYTGSVAMESGNDNDIIFTVTNTNKHMLFHDDGDLRVTKFWEDHRDSLGLRPASVTMQLLADGEEVEGATLVLNKQNGWSDCFTDLERYAFGKEIEYSVTEVDLSEDYQLDRIEKIQEEVGYELIVANRLISEEEPEENPEEPPEEPKEEEEDIPEDGGSKPFGGGDSEDTGEDGAAGEGENDDLDSPGASSVSSPGEGQSRNANAPSGQEETLLYRVKTGDAGMAPLFLLLLLVSGTIIVIAGHRLKRGAKNK